MVIRRILSGLLALTAVAAAGCTSSDASLPDGATLVKDAAAATAEIKSTHFTLQVNGKVSGLSVQSLDGDLTKDGQAQGTGTIQQAGQLVEVSFVLTGGTLYLKGPTGGYQEIPAAMSSAIYDPAAVLDPDRGIAKLVSSLQEPQTEAEEEVDGTPAYKIVGTVAKDVLAGLIPGIPEASEVSLWVQKDGKHLPLKATAALPDDASVDVTLSDVDKPVKIAPPA